MNKLEFHKHVFLRILFVVMLGVVTFNPIKFHSQEIPILTQFTSQDFIINPAFTGDPFFNETPIYITGREQWAGFTGGNPRTISVGGHGLIKKVGIGARIYRDEQGGAFSKDEFDFNIAVPIRFSKNSFLRFGLGGAFKSLRTDSNFENVDPSDPLLLQQESDVDLKTSFGLAYSANFVDGSEYYRLNLGWSFNNVDPKKFSQPAYAGMFEMYGYFNFFVYDDFKKFEINYLNKWRRDLPMQGDFIFLFGIQENVSLGFFQRFSYGPNLFRNSSYKYLLFGDALGPVVNFNLKKISLGYSIDFTGSAMRNHSSGTHEIVLKISPTQKNNPWLDNDSSEDFSTVKYNTKTKNKRSSKKLDEIIESGEFEIMDLEDDFQNMVKAGENQLKFYPPQDQERFIFGDYLIDGNGHYLIFKISNYLIEDEGLTYQFEIKHEESNEYSDMIISSDIIMYPGKYKLYLPENFKEVGFYEMIIYITDSKGRKSRTIKMDWELTD